MVYYVAVEFHEGPYGSRGPFTVGTRRAWLAFCDWAETLPEDLAALKYLTENGLWKGTDVLLEELLRAAPLIKVVASEMAMGWTYEELVVKIGVGDPEEVATVVEAEDRGFAPMTA